MSSKSADKSRKDEVMRMVADIVSAYLSHNSLAATEIPELISAVHGALADGHPKASQAQMNSMKPAVPIRRSIQDDHIICLEDGKKLKMLKRYLRTKFNMSPEEYRMKWGLPSDYPMVAPNYSKQRSAFAKNIGLGQRRNRAH